MLEVYRCCQDTKLSGESVATIGNFDGLHIGHQEIIRSVVAKATQSKLIPTLITFNPLPRNYFGSSHQALTTIKSKLKLLAKMGIKRVVFLRFNKKLAQCSADDFALKSLKKNFNIRELFLGEDFRFGNNRCGDIKLLEKLQDEEFRVHVVPDICQDSHRISSSLIREKINAGKTLDSIMLLGRPFTIEGRVIQGDKLGAQLNFPTANISPPKGCLLPHGVFLCEIKLPGSIHWAVTNVGYRPTISGQTLRVESHILDYSGNLYGQNAKLIFWHKLRDEKRFASLEELASQIKLDVAQARKIIS